MVGLLVGLSKFRNWLTFTYKKTSRQRSFKTTSDVYEPFVHVVAYIYNQQQELAAFFCDFMFPTCRVINWTFKRSLSHFNCFSQIRIIMFNRFQIELMNSRSNEATCCWFLWSFSLFLMVSEKKSPRSKIRLRSLFFFFSLK